MATGEVRTRKPGTNAFRHWLDPDPNSNLMTFSADGTAKSGCCCGYKKRRTSQKRAFHKVETRDLAGKWCGVCSYPMVFPSGPFSFSIFCTTKRALNEDQYTESGCCFFLCFPLSPVCNTHTRLYENGHATNGFARAFYDAASPDDIVRYRDAGCTRRGEEGEFAKKLC